MVFLGFFKESRVFSWVFPGVFPVFLGFSWSFSCFPGFFLEFFLFSRVFPGVFLRKNTLRHRFQRPPGFHFTASQEGHRTDAAAERPASEAQPGGAALGGDLERKKWWRGGGGLLRCFFGLVFFVFFVECLFCCLCVLGGCEKWLFCMF